MADDGDREAIDRRPESETGGKGRKWTTARSTGGVGSERMQVPGRTRGAGQSAGGPYPNSHSGKTERRAEADDKDALTNGGYHGGGQQGGQNWSGRDHHAASKVGDSGDK